MLISNNIIILELGAQRPSFFREPEKPPTKSLQYSKHSSLMTDLSLTPSPDNSAEEPDSSSSVQQSVSRVVEESLSTPQDPEEDVTSAHYNSPAGDQDDES